MKKRIISFITAFFMAATMIVGGTSAVSAATTEGGLLWNYRDVSNSAMTGVTSPTMDEDSQYIYMGSAKIFYKINIKTGKVADTVTLSGSVGYNKIAPVVEAGKAFIPLGAGKLDIVDVENMTLLKTVQFADAESHKGHQTLTPAVYDEAGDSVYLGTWRKGYGGVYAKVSLDDYTSTVIAESEEGFYWAGASASSDYVVFGSTSNGTDDMNTPSDGDAVLYAYNKADGTLLETTLADSGSICTTVVEEGGKYYFVSKVGQLYEASVENGQLQAAVKTKLAGKSTCTPIIEDGKAYIGSASKVEVVDLATGAVVESYSAPADVKGIAVVGDKIYCTYNAEPGGLYDVTAGSDYFVPAGNMQNYCISTIEAGSDGTLYYTNDSNNLMAVRDADTLINAAWASSTKTFSYKGKKVTPAVKVTSGGKTLKAGTDYDVTYSNNIYPGKATAVVKGKGTYAGVKTLTFTIAAPKVVSQKTVTRQLYGYDDFQVKWSTQSVAGATVKYKVQYQKYGGKWATLYSGTTKSSCKKANLSDGAQYRFKVTPYVTVNGKSYYGTSKTTGYMYTLKAPKKPTVKRVTAKKATLKWKKVYGATGYKIYRSKTKKGTYKYVKTVSSKYLSTKITAKKGSKYYYKVRAYKKVGKKNILGPQSSYRYYKFK